MKKIIAMSLAAVLALGCLGGCGGEETPPAEDPKKSIAIEVGAQVVSENEYYRYMYSERYDLLGIEDDTAEFWAGEKEKGVTYSDAAVEAVQKEWIVTKLYAEQFDLLGLSFTAEETERFNAALEQEITAAGGMGSFREQLIANRYTYEEYQTALLDMEKKDKVLTHYFGEGGEYAPKAEALADFYNENYARIKMIMVSKVDSMYGDLLPEEDLADAKEKAEDAYAAALKDTDPKRFNELISLYSADASTRGDGAIIHKDSEDEIASAILALMESQKTVSEGAGATTVAAYMFKKVDTSLKTVCVVSGGNIDVTTLSRVINRGLIKSGRLANITTKVIDKPGQLTSLLQIVAATGANINEIDHKREDVSTEVNSCVVSMVLETRNEQHVEEIISAIMNAGYTILH